MQALRPNWPTIHFAQAFLAARRGTCPRLKAGIIVADKFEQIRATGYNGAPSKADHCIDVGCLMLDGHCLTGDTIISKFQKGHYNTGHYTLEALYGEWSRSWRVREALKKMQIRAVDEHGMIVPDQITDVWQAGVRPVLRLTTSLGRFITATHDHRMLSPEGWVEAGSLRIGDRVGLNGLPLIDDSVWLREQYIEQGRTQLDIASLAGVSRNKVKRQLDRFGIERRPFKLGGWNRGMTGSQAYNFVATKQLATDNSARERARKLALGPRCIVCGATGRLFVHHRDRDVRNDNLDNLWTLCQGCHDVAHSPHAKRERVLYDTVVSITQEGEQPVYDLTTARYHNFIGNGFVVHNCLRTLHSEENALAFASRNRQSLEGCTAYITARPCQKCTKLMIQAGITEIRFWAPYNTDAVGDQVEQLCKAARVILRGPACQDYPLHVLFDYTDFMSMGL